MLSECQTAFIWISSGFKLFAYGTLVVIGGLGIKKSDISKAFRALYVEGGLNTFIKLNCDKADC